MHRYSDRWPSRRQSAEISALAVGAAISLAGIVLLYQMQTRNRVAYRPPDSAPGRTAKKAETPYAVVGRTVTIDKPRSELYAFWRDFSNLPKFMENVKEVDAGAGITRWSIAAPFDRAVNVETRIAEDRPDELIAWQSTENSEIETKGHVKFRDAPAGRGTEVEAVIAYKPPFGELGRWVAKAFQREPGLQGRRELKRLKMLMETGEIATAQNRRTPA